jgi:hypothetical protein
VISNFPGWTLTFIRMTERITGVSTGNQDMVKGKIIAAIKGTKNMGNEAGLTYNEYHISKAIQPQNGFVKKGFFKIEYFTKRFKAKGIALSLSTGRGSGKGVGDKAECVARGAVRPS